MRLIALFIVALVVGLTVRYNTFAAWATDSGAYLSAGEAWARGDLFTPATLVFWAPWAADGQVELPLGHVQGPVKGTITGQYPLGYPLLIAAALRLSGGSFLAPHVVSPLCAGILVWCAFLIGRRLSTAWAGVMAALLTAATPLVFNHSIMAFSDVPSTAFWALAWAMSMRCGHGAALAAGASAAMAVMIRPNLAPLAIVIAGALVSADSGGWRRAFTRLIAFGVTGALGPLFVLWSQAELYGHPLQNGYRVPMSHFFSMDRVPYNAGLYVRMLGDLHTWVVFAGLIYVPLALRQMRRSIDGRARAIIALTAVGIIVVNYLLYLPYLTYVGWYWLRFLLPALLAMFVLLAALSDELRLWIASRSARLQAFAMAPVLLVAWAGLQRAEEPVGYERILMTERYLAEVIPANGVLLTTSHGGAWTRVTGRPIVRLDTLAPENLDVAIRDLQRRGLRPVYVFDVAIEGDLFTHRYGVSPSSRLTWPARAEISSSTAVLYYGIEDRDAFFSGDRWTTDVLLGGRSQEALVAWDAMRGEHERLILPVYGETAAFRSELEAFYRGELGRSEVSASVHPARVLRWLRRYVRLRLHGCSHAVASDAIWRQIREGVVPRLCAAPDAIRFPPENETMEFRKQLDEWLYNTPLPQYPTYVDALGEVVWMQRYLEARMQGCSHRQASTLVREQIRGGQGSPCADLAAAP